MLKTLVLSSAVGLVVAVGAYFGFRGDEEVVITPTPEPSLTATATPSPDATATPAETETATPEPSATPEPTPTLEAGQKPADAPIESVDVTYQDGKPLVTIVAGLPDGCAKPYSQDVVRDGDSFVITILNSVPDKNAICTAIYRTYQIQVSIGDSLDAGQTYVVTANDQKTRFTAR